MTQPARLGDVSFWYADIGLPDTRRPALDGDAEADVCIIGAGYTGLWSAYYLKQAAPHLSIIVCERDFAGFGASGRNGGWLTGGFAWSHEKYLKTSSEGAVRAMVQAMNGTVDEVIRVAGAEGIEADILRTDELMVAVTPAQMARVEGEVAHRRHWGENRVHVIGAGQTRSRVNIPGALGAMVVEGVARVQPAKLARGLARVVEGMGVRICEGTTVTAIAPRQVTTDRGTVRARHILRCTEGFTAGLPGLRREWLPLNSAQIATEPLPPEAWEQIGWQGHEILGDFANAYCYCQRTREGRITVGARGVPYRFGSRTDTSGVPDAETVRRLTAILHRHFPVTRNYRIDHAWCGVLGVPRDWCATVGYDGATGMGFAGGYVGVGVSTSNLSGRTLADLVLARDSDLVRLPWVNRPVRKWEPEPLRWLGVRGMYALYNLADRHEAATGGPPSRLAKLGNWLTGR
ncbi:FAD-binding oxidoreductase [Rhodobacteraceae bacterium HSP-20]|uniref:FAD-binding oxidoreductase n=1 Tax=Paragemmobacter amnigenus TaxID=2852097 RepID=A0ABS6J8M5_9RHOB|nr:FAD-dependent oxidoreductase [Rhodobacter amnigenus]MBU9699962.1 FAD-binding oxidoreductase [Rhodobacter amnigenus]MBV4391189.1 FAD-binding oxidoreductase [Rhodobacter amnigenus]